MCRTSGALRRPLIASPTVFAHQLVGHEPCVAEIIDLDRHPRRYEGRQCRHRGVIGIFRMGIELREKQFDRIVLFTNYTNRSLVALTANLNAPWLRHDLTAAAAAVAWAMDRALQGPAVGIYEDATSFAIRRFSKC